MDKKYLKFGQEFDQNMLGQGFEMRTIEDTFALGWKLLGMLPKSELTRIKRETVEKYYVAASEEA